jgi:hypothetical protein
MGQLHSQLVQGPHLGGERKGDARLEELGVHEVVRVPRQGRGQRLRGVAVHKFNLKKQTLETRVSLHIEL